MKKTLPLIALFVFLASSGICLRHTAHAAQLTADKWTPFRNIEQVEYCLSLPLAGYARDYGQSDVRARHVFVNKTKKNTKITVAGLHRSDDKSSKTGAERYYQQYFAGAGEQGLIIEHRALDTKAARFYSTGYWSNSIHESRFVEIVWLRDSEVVKFHAAFPVADAGLWKSRLPELLKQSSLCT